MPICNCAIGFTYDILTNKCVFDGATAGFQDYSGNNNNGVITEPITLVSSPSGTGNAIYLNQTSGSVNLGNTFAITAQGLTLEWDIKKGPLIDGGVYFRKGGVTDLEYSVSTEGGSAIFIRIGGTDLAPASAYGYGLGLTAGTNYTIRIEMDAVNNHVEHWINGVSQGVIGLPINIADYIGTGDFVIGTDNTQELVIDNLNGFGYPVVSVIPATPINYTVASKPYDNTGSPVGNYRFDNKLVNELIYTCDPNTCYQDVIPAIQGPATYIVGAGSHAPNNLGAMILPDEIDGNTSGFTHLDSAFWVNRYSGGVWSASDPSCEFTGFDFCLDSADGDYLIGFSVDDVCRITINGVILAPEDTPTAGACSIGCPLLGDIITHTHTKDRCSIPPNSYFNLYKLPLSVGINSVKVEVLNASGNAGLSFDIAGPYPAGSLDTASGIYVQLDHDGSGVPQNYLGKIIHSDQDFIGEDFTTGDNSGYSCPEGYFLVACEDAPYCASVCPNQISGCCPDGYSLVGNGQCQKITTQEPSFNGNPYTIVKAPTNVAYGNSGARFYQPDNVTIDQDINGPSTIWFNTGGIGSRINLAGIWTNNGTLPLNEWVGFSQCIPLDTTKTYFLAIAGDNHYRFKVNGVVIVESCFDMASCSLFPSVNFNYQHVYEITLNAGQNVIEVLGRNAFGPAAFYAEIFDNTRAELKTATDIADLTVVFSTLDKVGGPFDVGDTVGYSCPNGYTLSTCDGPPMCILIENTPAVDCAPIPPPPCDFSVEFSDCRAVDTPLTVIVKNNQPLTGSWDITLNIDITSDNFAYSGDYTESYNTSPVINTSPVGTTLIYNNVLNQFEFTFTPQEDGAHSYIVTVSFNGDNGSCQSSLTGDNMFVEASNASNIAIQATGQVLSLVTPMDGPYQWYKDGVAINGAIQNTYTVTATGSYYLIIPRGLCLYLSNQIQYVYGCTDMEATNFNNLATNDDGSCVYSFVPITAAPICGKQRTQYLADTLLFANCNFGDKVTQYVDNERKGGACCGDMIKLKHLSMLISAIAQHKPVGDTDVIARSAESTFKILVFCNATLLKLRIKDLLNNDVAVYSVITNSINPAVIMLQLVYAINTHANIYGFIADINVDGSITLFAPIESGSNANGFTLDFSACAGSTIDLTNAVFAKGRDEVCVVESCLSETDIDNMLEKIKEISDNCCCSADGVGTDDATPYTNTGETTPIPNDNGTPSNSDNASALDFSNPLELEGGGFITPE